MATTPKILASVLGVLVALAGIDYGMSLYKERQAETADKLFPGFDPLAITEFSYRSTVTTPATELIATKQIGQQSFVITSPIATKADTRAIRQMAQLLAGAKFRRLMAGQGDSQDQLAEFGLDDPEVAIGFVTPKGRYQLAIGHRSPTDLSRYAAVVGRSGVYVIDDKLYSLAAKPLLAFRDRRIITIPLAKIDEIRYQASPGDDQPLTSVTLLNDGERWRLADGKRGSSTSITDFVTALNNLEALRIVDNPSDKLQDAYHPRRRSVSPLISARFTLETGEKQELTVVELPDSLLAYQDIKERLYFLPLSVKNQLLYTAFDFSYRKVLELDWPKVSAVQIGRRRYVKAPAAPAGGEGLGAKAGVDSAPGELVWQATDEGAQESPLTIDVKAFLIALEFAKADATFTSDQLPDSYDSVGKTEVVLSLDNGPAVTLNIAKLPRFRGGVAVLHHSLNPSVYYQVNLATARHLP